MYIITCYIIGGIFLIPYSFYPCRLILELHVDSMSLETWSETHGACMVATPDNMVNFLYHLQTWRDTWQSGIGYRRSAWLGVHREVELISLTPEVTVYDRGLEALADPFVSFHTWNRHTVGLKAFLFHSSVKGLVPLGPKNNAPPPNSTSPPGTHIHIYI